MNGLPARARTCQHCKRRRQDNEFFQFGSDRSVPEFCRSCAVAQGIIGPHWAESVVYARLRARYERRAQEQQAFSQAMRTATSVDREELSRRFHRALTPDEWRAWTVRAESEFMRLWLVEAARHRWFRAQRTGSPERVHEEAYRYYLEEYRFCLVGPDSPETLIQRGRDEAAAYMLYCVRQCVANPARWWVRLPPLGSLAGERDPATTPWLTPPTATEIAALDGLHDTEVATAIAHRAVTPFDTLPPSERRRIEWVDEAHRRELEQAALGEAYRSWVLPFDVTPPRHRRHPPR